MMDALEKAFEAVGSYRRVAYGSGELIDADVEFGIIRRVLRAEVEPEDMPYCSDYESEEAYSADLAYAEGYNQALRDLGLLDEKELDKERAK